MKINWQTKKLDEICDFLNGLWKGKEPPYLEVGVIRNTNFTKDCRLGDTDIAYLDVEVKQYNKRKLKYGDIILEKSGGGPKQPVGRVIVFDIKEGEYSFSNFTSVLRVKRNNQVDFNYLHKFLFFQYISGVTEVMQNHSTGIRNLNFNLYKNIEIPLPSFPKQQRIVKILDEVFEGVDKAKENAKKNIQNARELFESYLQNVFMNSGDGWEEEKLGTVCEIRPPKKKAQEKLKSNDLVSFVPMEDLLTRSKDFVADKERKLEEVYGSYTYFADEDVLLAKITPCFENGKIGVARNLKNGIGFGSSEYIVFRIKGEIIPDYLFYFLSRDQFRKEGKKEMAGAVGHKRVSKDFVENYRLPFPKSIAEQKVIVAKLDTLSEETKKLENIYTQKLTNLDELKKSILKKAFSGEL